MTAFIKYIYNWNLRLLINVINIKTKVLPPNEYVTYYPMNSQTWRSNLLALSVLKKVIPETGRVH